MSANKPIASIKQVAAGLANRSRKAQLTLRLNNDTYDYLRVIAEETGVSVNELTASLLDRLVRDDARKGAE